MNWFSRYLAYGTRFDEVGATYDRQRENTKDEEEDLNLLNEGFRYRDLEHGVWLSLDPIGFGDGPNVYCYVHCNPITHFDALGLEDFVVLPARRMITDQADADTVSAWISNAAKDSSIILIYAAGFEDARSQILGKQADGITIDNLTFDSGHGLEGSQKVGGGAYDNKKGDSHLTSDTLSQFYRKDDEGQIQLEEGAEVRYNGCNVGKGDVGKGFLSESARLTRRDSIAHEGSTGWAEGTKSPGLFWPGHDQPKHQNWSLKKWGPSIVAGFLVPDGPAGGIENKVAPRTYGAPAPVPMPIMKSMLPEASDFKRSIFEDDDT